MEVGGEEVPCVKLVDVAVGTTAENLEGERIEDAMDLVLRLALKSRIQLRRHFADF